MGRSVEIDEKTKVPLFAVLAALSVLIPMLAGGIFWMTSIDAKASQSASIVEMVIDMNARLIRVEQKVDDLKGGK